MDNVAVNVVSWESYVKNKAIAIVNDPVDAKWHIYDPITKTERVVQGIMDNGYNITRTKHGRYCDMVPSKCSTDNKTFATNYCDQFNYGNSQCRVVARSDNGAHVLGGLAYANASVASSFSGSYCAARLAFRGTISVKTE